MDKPLKIKIVFIIFLSLIYLTLILTISVLFIEISKIGSKLQKNRSNTELHNTEYYDDKLDFNPYRKFDKKYLHPFLTFSMPSRKKDILNINNQFVNLNENGLRINPNNHSNSKKNILFLGGSAAFGYYSSKDKETLAAKLTDKTNHNFYNLNGPSWNSHQELISLLKYKENYNLSISFSANNDFSIFCSKTINTEFEKNYVDAVERYKDINDVFLSLTDNKIYHIDGIVILKYFIVNNFSETLKVINHLKNKKRKKNLPNQAYSVKSKCLDENDKIKFENLDRSIDQFILNQINMRKLSKSRNADHILVIQPFYILQKNNPIELIDADKLDLEIFDYIISKIMESDFCKINCINFSKIFDEKNITTTSYMNNTSGTYNNELFIDNIHLSDIGNEIIANELVERIKF